MGGLPREPRAFLPAPTLGAAALQGPGRRPRCLHGG